MTQRSVTNEVGKQTDKGDFDYLGLKEFRQFMTGEGDRRHRTTSFHRHLDVFRYMRESVMPDVESEKQFVEALIIGAGLYRSTALREYPQARHRKWSYEAFHVAAMLEESRIRKAGGFDYQLMIMDKDPVVVESLNRQTSVLVSPLMNGKYASNLFAGSPRKSISATNSMELVRVPPAVKDRMNIEVGDIISSDIPQSDIIFFLNVHQYIPDEARTIVSEKILNALNKGGVLVTDDAVLCALVQEKGLKRDPKTFEEDTVIYRG